MSHPPPGPPHGIALTIGVGGIAYDWDPRVFYDLAHPVAFSGADPSAFGLPAPRAVSVAASVHAATVHDLNPHTATHIEGLAHLEGSGVPIGELLEKFLFPATLTTVLPERAENGDAILRRDTLAAGLGPFDPFQEAVIIRSFSRGCANTRFTGTNPPYFEPEAAAFLSQRGTRLLAVDLPSLDREEDGGALAAHRAFLGGAGASRAVIELARIPAEAPDGRYLLEVVPLRWQLDASPVRPILYGLKP
jgi:kynurenine formamidase